MALYVNFVLWKKPIRRERQTSIGVLPVEKTRVTILPSSMSNFRRLFRIQVRFSFARQPRRFTDFSHHEA